jgi:FhaA, N-terminal domain/FHA domain
VGVLQRFERRLGGLVEGIFARAFKSEVQPVEVAAALQRELDDQAAVVGRDRTLVPNHFVVELGDHDHDRLGPYATPLTAELAAMVREHAEEQRYSFVGPVQVELEHTPSLDTGVFHIRSNVLSGPDAQPVPMAVVAQQQRPPAPPPPVGSEVDDEGPADLLHTTTLSRSPAGQAVYGQLAVREGKGASYTVDLRRPVVVIGRGSDADVRVTDQAVSRRHAELHLDGAGATLIDLQSTNGTLVNGERVTTARLGDGDEIGLGETLLVFHRATGERSGHGPTGQHG